jgi:dihydroorotate dehydrogenase
MEKKDKGVSLNIGSLNVPNRNGVSYSPDAIEAALERALDGSKVSANAALFPNGQIPNFAQFLKMIAPHLSEEKIRMMAEMAERMPDYPDMVRNSLTALKHGWPMNRRASRFLRCGHRPRQTGIKNLTS